MIRVNDELSIPDDEIVFEMSTSSGPGGQHVNRVQTRVTLSFDVDRSMALGDREQARIRDVLASRINKSGQLQVRSERHRSQRMNREDAVRKFAELLRDALTPEAPRKKTRVSRAVKARRLDEKKRRSNVKRDRQKSDGEE